MAGEGWSTPGVHKQGWRESSKNSPSSWSEMENWRSSNLVGNEPWPFQLENRGVWTGVLDEYEICDSCLDFKMIFIWCHWFRYRFKNDTFFEPRCFKTNLNDNKNTLQFQDKTFIFMLLGIQIRIPSKSNLSDSRPLPLHSWPKCCILLRFDPSGATFQTSVSQLVSWNPKMAGGFVGSFLFILLEGF